MKITETIERDCCAPGKDLIAYKGVRNNQTVRNTYMFCKYCGQIWEHERYTDAAGSTDARLVKVFLP